jgi:hypothetical protein
VTKLYCDLRPKERPGAVYVDGMTGIGEVAGGYTPEICRCPHISHVSSGAPLRTLFRPVWVCSSALR